MPKISQFDMRIHELQQAIERLKRREKEGWRYKRTWVKGTTVKQHRRSGYFAMLPSKRK